MWQSIVDFFKNLELSLVAYGAIVLGLLFCICYIIHYRRAIAWWWLRFYYEFPLIGKIAQLSRDRRMGVQRDGWRPAELVLCQDFYEFSRRGLDPMEGKADFERLNKYIKYAGDSGRSPMPIWAWFLTVLMVVAEAYAFSIILSAYQTQNATGETQQMMAYGIASMLSVLLVAFSHFSGHELYVSSRIKFLHRQWEDMFDGRGNLEIKPVDLNSDQEVDLKTADMSENPFYIRMLNRIQRNQASYYITIATVILVVIVSISAAAMRWEDMKSSMVTDKETKQSTAVIDNDSTNPFDNLNAPKDSSPLGSADSSSETPDVNANESQKIKERGSLIAFMLLSVVFAALQILGMIFGWHWGFAGRESKEAYYRLMAGGSYLYATFDELQDDWRSMCQIAQAKLMTLQHRIDSQNFVRRREAGQNSEDIGDSRKAKTFFDYIEWKKEDDERLDNLAKKRLITYDDKSGGAV